MITIGDERGAVYQLETAGDLVPSGGRIRLTSSSVTQVRKLPGGGSFTLDIEWAADAGHPIALQGFDSPKNSHDRPLVGGAAVNGALQLTGTGELRVVLGNGAWTIQP